MEIRKKAQPCFSLGVIKAVETVGNLIVEIRESLDDKTRGATRDDYGQSREIA